MRDTEGTVPQPAFDDEQNILARVAAPAESLLPSPKLLIVLAHPDDEVVALGARLERSSRSHLLTVTDGAPVDGADAIHHGFASLEEYRTARQAELRRALADAGLAERVVGNYEWLGFFPVADQTVCLHLAQLTRVIASVVEAFKPEAVLTHPFEGGHPDHDGCAFAVHTAMKMLKRKQASSNEKREPLIIEAPFYFAGEDGSMRTSDFLRGWPSALTIVCELLPEEQSRKRTRLACFESQAETLAQFGVERELFRLAPAYDFSQPPHTGQLFYERFSWGMTGKRFQALVEAARGELGLESRGEL